VDGEGLIRQLLGKQRQLRLTPAMQERRERRRHEHHAQVHHERREDDGEPGRRRGQQSDGDILRRTGVDQDRHRQRIERRKPELLSQDSKGETNGNIAYHDRESQPESFCPAIPELHAFARNELIHRPLPPYKKIIAPAPGWRDITDPSPQNSQSPAKTV
jgi:hypothetical protein